GLQRKVITSLFFSSRRRHTRFSRDWSSDVCSSDLLKERVPDKASASIDADDADNPGSFELAGGDLSDLDDLDVVVLPPQADEFRSEERRVGKECRSRREAGE